MTPIPFSSHILWAVSYTHLALSREPNVALIADMYGSESDEFKGVMVCYIAVSYTHLDVYKRQL